MVSSISVRGASEHNLKAVDVDLPRGRLVVVCGVSGSGKSSLVFDTICREAQRRYLETFSSYARQFLGRMARPAVSTIQGLSPAIAVDQKTTVRNPRSTVGTLSGLYDDLRLLFARLGRGPDGLRIDRQRFSFNSPRGACPVCRGLGVEDRLDPDLLVADPTRTLRQGALVITTPTGYVIYSQVTIDVLDQVCRAHGFDVDTPWQALTAEQRDVVLNGSDRLRIPYGKHPLESRLRWTGITARPREEGIYKGILPVMDQILKRSRNRNILRFVRSLPCRACGGSRLNDEARSVHVRDCHIGQVASLAASDLGAWIGSLTFSAAEAAVGQPIRDEMIGRIRLIDDLGLGHLTLDRGSLTLSGGEAQRLRLASQVGAELGGVLYVFDEPSTGLHAVDQGRLLDVLERLRDRGNTVMVVEHDDQTIRRGDWIVDVGPGAGVHGGEVLFSGPTASFLDGADPRSRTRAFLAGVERLSRPRMRREGGVLRLADACRHNLQHLDVEFLLAGLNVVTGVSGAGKSSLVEELADRARDGRLAVTVPIGKVIEIDQAPIGRTPRSNPATYTGLSDVIRDVFAAEPEAVARRFDKGRFSFNVVGGRCEACQGAGVQQVGMHFLGQVDVVCDVCGGRRFNAETLDIRYRGRSIHDVLEMTIEEAGALLAGHRRADRILSTLQEIGLGYVRLGQPSTTLSGGEAQRVKLAAELSRPGRGHTLYLLDEPTTGLHQADVGVLLRALTRLVEQGHTVVAIEHHLDVIASADRVIDLGPGSGARGGRLVACGPPEVVATCAESATGRALRGQVGAERATPSVRRSEAVAAPPDQTMPLRFEGVTTHNLKHVEVTIPASRLTVITGVSGSGKSSLAFDTIYAEGRTRFTESFSAYGRRFLEKTGDAEFERVSGLRPAVAIRQRRPSRNPRSTVGTMTEIADLYRLLFARAGVSSCPSCDQVLDAARCPTCGRHAPSPLTATMFSPNAEQGACRLCKGLGVVRECDPERLITDPTRSLFDGAMAGHRTGRFYGDPFGQHLAILRAAGRTLGYDVEGPWSRLAPEARALVMGGAGDREFDVEWRFQRGARRGVHHLRARWLGLVAYVGQEYARKHSDSRGEALEPLMHDVPCRECRGARLRPESLAVRVAGRSIADLLRLTVDDSLDFFERTAWEGRTALVTADLRRDVLARLRRLRDAGLGYLSLDRPATTLSAGEAQRIRLATEIGSGLTGIVYVLDEPTVGLHPRDTRALVTLLRALCDTGNTVVVVEHDPDVMRAADHLIDIGPGAGDEGGRIVVEGTPSEVARHPTSHTGRLLRASDAPPDAAGGGGGQGGATLRPGLTVRGATCHNLLGLDVHVPAGGLVAITGVSGSGKSTLLFDVVAPAVEAWLAGGPGRRADAASVDLHEPFVRVVASNRDWIARTPTSMPVTITGVFDHIRRLYSAAPEARARGLAARHFSTTVAGGRCEACEGMGRVRVSMDFLPDVWVPCEACSGSRFGEEVLAVPVAGRTIAETLALSVGDARRAFEAEPQVCATLAVLDDLGLGYLRLGQGADTLSGGERQRLMLATELATRGAGPALFLFDEPTTGLHAEDVRRLLVVLRRLVDAGHSLVVVEHNLQVIEAADWVIDLGPEAGPRGGRLVAEGPPDVVARHAESWTGRALAGSGRVCRPERSEGC